MALVKTTLKTHYNQDMQWVLDCITRPKHTSQRVCHLP